MVVRGFDAVARYSDSTSMTSAASIILRSLRGRMLRRIEDRVLADFTRRLLSGARPAGKAAGNVDRGVSANQIAATSQDFTKS